MQILIAWPFLFKELKMINVIEKLLDIKYPDWRNDYNFKGTPERVSRFYDSLTWDKVKREENAIKHIVTFPGNDSKIITVPAISAGSLCPHHLLPVSYKITLGYMTKQNTPVLGASKLIRIARELANGPVLQEDLTTNIGSFLNGCVKTHGTAVIIKGVHGCMQSRGVHSINPYITSELTGVFKENAKVRDEFYHQIVGEY